MDLLVIAHRGEAQTFIKELSLKVSNDSLAFYQNPELNLGLLVCGEGLFEVMAKLPYIIGKFDISSITNLGIAGALNPTLNLNQIYPIRTFYSYLDAKPQFKSYTTDSDKTKLDGISCIDRIINTDMSERLSDFADIVDREGWAIGRVSKLHKIPFYSYKLISDFASDGTECLSIKERALEFSDLLYCYYRDLKKLPITESTEYSLEGINASFTQQKRIKKLLSQLTVKYPETKSMEHLKSSGLDLSLKTNINPLCESLEKKLSSMESEIFNKIDNCFVGLNEVGAKVTTDPKKESSDFTLNMKINSEQNIKKLKHALDSFDYETYNNLWNGNV